MNLIRKKVLHYVTNPAYWINGAKHGHGKRIVKVPAS